MGAVGSPLLTGCFLCLDAYGAVAKLEHRCLALACLAFVQVEMPQRQNDGSWVLAMASLQSCRSP